MKKKCKKLGIISLGFLFGVFFSLLVFISSIIIFSIYHSDIYSEKSIVYSPEDYIYYPSVQEVSRKCLNATIKSKCVFDEIPFKYTNRSEGDNTFVLSPDELYIDGKGICRDIALFRMAVFYNMNVSASYFFTPNYINSTHVFVVTNEDGVFYELNNQYFIELSVGDILEKETELEMFK